MLIMTSALLFKSIDILPIGKHVYNSITIMVYKYEHVLLPIVMNELYTTNSDIHYHYTRHVTCYYINKGNIYVFTKSCTLFYIVIYSIFEH